MLSIAKNVIGYTQIDIGKYDYSMNHNTTGKYDYCMNHKYNETLTFKIENEMDLHVKVVSFLKKKFLHSVFTATLGENQCTSAIRIDSYKKGYLRGSPHLIINNLHKNYTGFCIEFKNPNGKGILSPDQSMML